MMTERSDTAVARSFAQDRTQVYVELTKPRITLMVLLTVAIGYALAPVAPHARFALLHVLIGAFLSCSGAGALNQLIERDVDGAMNRTRFRPLPAHRVSPLSVLLLGTAMAAGGVVYLALTTNGTTALLDATTLVIYLFIYTPLKRISSLSTLAGAVPGALPPVMGWAAATTSIAPNALILFSILFLWQIPHFLAIGRMYQDDYASGGLPMLAVVDEDGSITGRQMMLYALALIPVSLMPAMVGLTGNLYFWAALAAGLAYLGASIHAALRGGRGAARQLLLVSVLYLPLLFAAMLVDRIGG
jgi:protoheme IX farnesyltransferase